MSGMQQNQRRGRGNTTLRLALSVGFALVAVFLFFRPSSSADAASRADAGPAEASAASGPADAGGSSVSAPKITIPTGEPQRLTIQTDKLIVKASSRGARVTSVRLPGFTLRATDDPAAAKDPERCLELLYHSGAPVSALSVFAPLGTYSDTSHPLHGLVGVLETADWKMEEVPPGEGRGPGVRWTIDAAHLRIRKTLVLDASGYRGSFDLEVEALDSTLEESQDALAQLQLLLVPGGWLFSDHDQFFASPSGLAGIGDPASPTVLERMPATFKPTSADSPEFQDLTDKREGVRFVVDANKYFLAGIAPKDPPSGEAIGAVRALGIPFTKAEFGVETRVATAALLVSKLPKLGQPLKLSYHTYFGPKRAEDVAAVPVLETVEQHSRSDFGVIRFVANLLLAVLRFFQSVTGNWGIAIILLTVLVRALLIPMNRRMQASMAGFAQKQQALKPRLEALEKKFGGDSKRLNEEKLKLFRETGTPVAPPVMGCLPVLIIQMPVFFGLFAALRTTYDLRHAPFFGWIRDLSSPDAMVLFDGVYRIPVLGMMTGDIRGLNVLPILMVVLWLAHQRLMPKPTDPQQAQMQNIMMFLPLVFGLTLYNYAAGLSVYMITSSVIGIFEQTLLKKIWPPAGGGIGAAMIPATP